MGCNFDPVTHGGYLPMGVNELKVRSMINHTHRSFLLLLNPKWVRKTRSAHSGPVQHCPANSESSILMRNNLAERSHPMSKRCCAPNFLGGLAALLGVAAFAIAFIASMAPAEAGLVAGANGCGDYVNRAPSTISASSMPDLRKATICLINAERTTRQLPTLSPNMALDKAALGHAGEAQRLKWWTAGADPHVNPETGSTIDSRLKAAGYCGANPNRTGEVAYTWAGDQATPVGAVNWWMNISMYGHREAILDASIKEIGVGIGGQVADKSLQPRSDMGTYVVNFGACASGAPAPQAEGSPADTKVPTDTIVKPGSDGLFQEKLKYRDRILKSP
jgi:uncharacterized protein YkwD